MADHPAKEPRLIRRRPRSPFWQFDIPTPDGRRIRRSAETDNEAEALAQARIIWAEEKARAASGNKQIEDAAALTLSQALGRYWLEHAQFLPSAGDIKRMSATLIEHFSADKLLTSFAPPELVTFAAMRRTLISNRSVNVELVHLRAVMNRAHEAWNAPEPPIKSKQWGAIFLIEAGEREHILSVEEEVRLFLKLRPDFHAFVRFALLTGMRLDNVITLTWKQIDFDEGLVTIRQKSKRPGGELHYVPIEAPERAILAAERGRHPERVFTYVCQRTRYDPRSRTLQREGQRYPFTHDGWRRPWMAALAAAEIEDFRFHDLRHTALTKITRVSNVKVAQRLAGHKDVRTTLRYIKSDLSDVRAAMRAVSDASVTVDQESHSPKRA